MKNEHIVQFLEAFPFNPSCNQLLDKLNNLKNLDEISIKKSSEQAIQSTGDLTVNANVKLNRAFQLAKLLDFCKRFHKKLRQLHTKNVKNDTSVAIAAMNDAGVATLTDTNSNRKRSGEANQNVHKVEVHLYDLLFLIQKIKLGLETSEDVYKIMTDEKYKTKMFVPLYFEIVTNNGEDEVYLELIQDEQYPSFVELYSKNNPDGLELKEFLNLNIYFSYFISFLMSWLCKQDVLEEKGKTDFIKFFRYFLKTQDKITDFIKKLE